MARGYSAFPCAERSFGRGRAAFRQVGAARIPRPHTGWRRSEVATLQWLDVNLPSREIRLRSAHSKNKRPRVVKLGSDLLALVERRAGDRRLDYPLVFQQGGHPLGGFRKHRAAACTAAGFAGTLFHHLRRSAVRNIVRAGTPERAAMRISGHRTRSVFDRYDITSEADLRRRSRVYRASPWRTTRRQASRGRAQRGAAHPLWGRTRTEHGHFRESCGRRPNAGNRNPVISRVGRARIELATR
jgi:integrase